MKAPQTMQSQEEFEQRMNQFLFNDEANKAREARFKILLLLAEEFEGFDDFLPLEQYSSKQNLPQHVAYVLQRLSEKGKCETKLAVILCHIDTEDLESIYLSAQNLKNKNE